MTSVRRSRTIILLIFNGWRAPRKEAGVPGDIVKEPQISYEHRNEQYVVNGDNSGTRADPGTSNVMVRDRINQIINFSIPSGQSKNGPQDNSEARTETKLLTA